MPSTEAAVVSDTPQNATWQRHWARPPAALSSLSGRTLALLALTLFALNAWLHFPGSMNNDSVQQYQQALRGQYQDWHPPVMAWLWSLTHRIAPGPGPLLLLHLAGYWGGLALLADGLRRSGRPRAALAVLAIGLFPTFIYLNATVAKDAAMIAGWSLALGAICWFRLQGRRIAAWGWLLILPPLAYGLLVRGNAVFGLGPLLLLMLWWRPERLRFVSLAGAAVLAAVLALPASQWVNARVFQAQATQPVLGLYLFDLLGIAQRRGEPALLEPRATLSPAQLDACYTSYWWDSLSPWGRCGPLVHRPAGDTPLVTLPEGASAQWLRTIAAHPLDYAVHRLKHFNSALMFAVPLKHVRFVPEMQAGDAAFQPNERITERDIKLDLLRKSPHTWPAVWMAWGLALLVLLHRRPTTSAHATAELLRGTSPSAQADAAGEVIARALCVSALSYGGAYLLVGVSTDMRYFFWSMLAVLLASALALPRLALAWRTRDRALMAGLGAVATVVAIGLATRLLDVRAFI